LNQRRTVAYYLGLSAVAAVLLIIVSLIDDQENNPITADGKLLIGAIFIASCIFGITFAIFPNWFKQVARHQYLNTKIQSSQENERKFLGHHPDCEVFRNHRIEINNNYLCAGCFGLFLGALISIILMIVYIGVVQDLTSGIAFGFIVVGYATISLAYLEIMLTRRKVVLHIVSNASIMIAFLLIVIGMLEVTGNEIAGLLSIFFSFLWIDTRIRISKWSHSIDCANCSEICKIY